MRSLSISVVIPCHNNAFPLSMSLRAIAAQSLRPREVICVDDSSGRGSLRKISELTSHYDARFLELPRTGRSGRRSAARNLGSKCAHGDILLYLDGDMLIGPRYIETILQIHSTDGGAVVYGRRLQLSAVDQLRGPIHCLGIVARGPAGSNEARTISPHSDNWEQCLGNNLSVRRTQAELVGLWDENFVGWGEEDIDFAYRLCRNGCRIVLPESGPVYAYHLDHKRDYARNLASLRRNAAYFLSKFPELGESRSRAVSGFYYMFLVKANEGRNRQVWHPSETVAWSRQTTSRSEDEPL